MSEAHNKIKKSLNGDSSFTVEELTEAAFIAWQTMPINQCYWNDKFFLAIHFNLFEGMQREAAIHALCNAEDGYWMWHTHYGYDLVKALRSIGITEGVPKSDKDVEGGTIYTHCPTETRLAICSKFKIGDYAE